MSVIPDTWELRKENYRSQASLGNLGTLSLGVSLGIPLYQELFKKNYIYFVSVCDADHTPWHVCGSQKTTCPSTMWILGIKLQFLGLVASALTH